MKYAVKYPTGNCQKRVEKVLAQVSPDTCQKILDIFEELAVQPRPMGISKIKPPLEVGRFLCQYRIRIGDLRLLYDIDDKSKTVWIVALRKRNEDTYK